MRMFYDLTYNLTELKPSSSDGNNFFYFSYLETGFYPFLKPYNIPTYTRIRQNKLLF